MDTKLEVGQNIFKDNNVSDEIKKKIYVKIFKEEDKIYIESRVEIKTVSSHGSITGIDKEYNLGKSLLERNSFESGRVILKSLSQGTSKLLLDIQIADKAPDGGTL